MFLTYLHCMHGVPGAPFRTEYTVFVREPRADDVWPDVRLRGQSKVRYTVISAA